MPDVMKEDETSDPVAIALFGPVAIVAGAKRIAKTIEEFRSLLRWG
jgi:hypothetical protein